MFRMKDLLPFVVALDCESFVLRNGATTRCYLGRRIAFVFYSGRHVLHVYKIYRIICITTVDRDLIRAVSLVRL